MGIKIAIDREVGLALYDKTKREKARSGGYSKDIDEFLELVSEAWEDFQNRNSVPFSQWIPIKYTSPKEFLESPDSRSDVILFKLKNRRRFNSSPGGERREHGTSVREEIDDPEDSNNTITILGRKRENIVEFEIWGTHSKRANQTALKFEGFMHAYDWYFTDKGINRVWFEQRTEDRLVETGGTEWSVRTLQFLVTTELIYKEVDRKLELITVRHDTGSNIKTETIDESSGLQKRTINR
jgi:hypothetical protein